MRKATCVLLTIIYYITLSCNYTGSSMFSRALEYYNINKTANTMYEDNTKEIFGKFTKKNIDEIKLNVDKGVLQILWPLDKSGSRYEVIFYCRKKLHWYENMRTKVDVNQIKINIVEYINIETYHDMKEYAFIIKIDSEVENDAWVIKTNNQQLYHLNLALDSLEIEKALKSQRIEPIVVETNVDIDAAFSNYEETDK